jgi:FkbM family methyltransferase
MTFLGRSAAVSRDAVRVLRGPLPMPLKRSIVTTHAALSVRALSGDRQFFGKLLNYQVEAFSVRDAAFLFREIFIDLDYYFNTTSRAPFIIDCGSNIGMAILFFKTIHPDATVIGFEPGPDSFAMLQRNVATNRLSNVNVYQYAAGATDGSIDFFYAARPGSFTSSTAPERTGGQKTSVRQVKLSSFIDRDVDFLKLDFEGSEWAVLGDLIQSGAIHAIKQMIIEYHHHMKAEDDRFGAFLTLLEDCGFGYQLRASAAPGDSRGAFQDVLVYAYKKGVAAAMRLRT